jgi:hypothetical protein
MKPKNFPGRKNERRKEAAERDAIFLNEKGENLPEVEIANVSKRIAKVSEKIVPKEVARASRSKQYRSGARRPS